jgi:hypothetical protein
MEAVHRDRDVSLKGLDFDKEVGDVGVQMVDTGARVRDRALSRVREEECHAGGEAL